ncbi:Os03g0830950 [Oryza sativa Japonica Group]|uniref:Os03g0830950 protein n=1 Tax=Oryza sativa subsp. japonica TaxID=39947 RepID=A0A0P0W5I3_ORYSJ|nr:hypothetical protein EE612_021458 [Oryza sativa]BAS87197.1 Os03g0830950 [Oryza sativa Japonica Group]
MFSLSRTCKSSSAQVDKLLQCVRRDLLVEGNHFHYTHAANHPRAHKQEKIQSQYDSTPLTISTSRGDLDHHDQLDSEKIHESDLTDP